MRIYRIERVLRPRGEPDPSGYRQARAPYKLRLKSGGMPDMNREPKEDRERASPLWGRGRPGKKSLTREDMQQVQRSPEWLAVKGVITAAEYLMTFGDYRGPIELIEHEH